MGLIKEEDRAVLRNVWSQKLEDFRGTVKSTPTSVLFAYIYLDGGLGVLNQLVRDAELDAEANEEILGAAMVAVADEIDHRTPPRPGT